MIITDSHNQLPPKIIILGDLIIDETWYVKVEKVSPEAPVPVAAIMHNEPCSTPGGAGLAAMYAAKEKIPSIFLAAVSPEANEVLNKTKIDYFSIDDTPNNVKKIRYIDKESKYHLIRVDTDNITNDSYNSTAILSALKECIKENNIKCLAMLNYRKGTFRDSKLCENIIKLCKEYNIPTFIDTREDVAKFNSCTTAKLNTKELKAALVRNNCKKPSELRKLLDIQHLIVTKAADGADIYTEDSFYSCLPRKLSGNPDVTGAGDVFDINFCYHYYLLTNKSSIIESLTYSVNKATEYVRQPIETRLW